jgi:GTP cyclohydrolase I
MKSKAYLQNSDIENLCLGLGDTLASIGVFLKNGNGRRLNRCYPIPRGGVPAAYALSAEFDLEVVDDPAMADFFVDDIIDSGASMRLWCDEYPGKPFIALVDKTLPATPFKGKWVVFPWEGDASTGIEGNIRRILQWVGEDVDREGLSETPARVAKALAYWCKGYQENAADVLKVFEDGADGYDEMVVVKDIPFYSKCEHHMADIFGTATIAYIPDGKIVGLSKLSRLVDVFARRLQVQERLTSQVADSLVEHLAPKGVGVVIKARHMCMESRGVCKQGHHTITSALRGVIKEDPSARLEFITLVK